jgi:hypothetical protein
MTPWLAKNLADAEELFRAHKNQEALKALLVVLSVSPNSPEALRLLPNVLYIGARKDQASPLSTAQLGDPRLDSIFCSCDAPECTAWWISHGQLISHNSETIVTHPRGVRCLDCGRYFCRHHYSAAKWGTIYCPRCGGKTDPAPRTPNGRTSTQSIRLNQPLAHVYVIREGPERIGPDYIQSILSAISPDVFEDRPRITSSTDHPWPDNPQSLAMARILADGQPYLTDRYKVYFFPGTDGDDKRFLLIKVFAKTAKYADPDAQTS